MRLSAKLRGLSETAPHHLASTFFSLHTGRFSLRMTVLDGSVDEFGIRVVPF